MKRYLLLSACALIAASLSYPASLLAQLKDSPIATDFGVYSTNVPGLSVSGVVRLSTLETLITNQIPRAQFFESCSGTFYSLANPQGDQVQVNLTHPEKPTPAIDASGYWDGPIMNFLGRQKIKGRTASEAVSAVQLYLTLSHGLDSPPANPCQAQRFDDRWVVTVEPDFTHHPGSIMAVMPFELQVDKNSAIVQFRERSYDYPGSAHVYTNTVISTFKRAAKNQGGTHYPEAVTSALKAAWKKECQKLPDATSQ